MTEQLQRGKLLRVVSPELYGYLSDEFEKKFNIHPFDIQLEGIEREDGIQVLLHYGEGFANQMDTFFPYSAIAPESDELKEFTVSAGETCKEAMVADYYKMMDL
jgi:hypothetical protein